MHVCLTHANVLTSGIRMAPLFPLFSFKFGPLGNMQKTLLYFWRGWRSAGISWSAATADFQNCQKLFRTFSNMNYLNKRNVNKLTFNFYIYYSLTRGRRETEDTFEFVHLRTFFRFLNFPCLIKKNPSTFFRFFKNS